MSDARHPAAHPPNPLRRSASSPEIREQGGLRQGQPQFLDRRLFMQLLAFGNAPDPAPLQRALEAASLSGVIYADLHDPRGLALLTWSDDPALFLGPLRAALQAPALAGLALKPEYTMFGRTYALGHEPDLADWLIEKPRRNVLNPAWPWAVWYPLRRKGEFSALAADEVAPILREHGRIGHAFGEAGYAQDVRLACFGLDAHDNDFVIGLLGERLHPLSACVQAMRKTRQTSEFIQSMGPFFIGRALWRSPA